MYHYDFTTRSDETDANGDPALLTRAADEDAAGDAAARRHDLRARSNGRRIYVNGEFTGDTDPRGGGTLADWDDTFALVLGNEVSSNRQWDGVIRLVAIHNRALTPAQIQQNFEAGVGEKFFLLFSSATWSNVPQAYVMFEASQFDSYGYLFSKPTFISLDADGDAGPASRSRASASA